eukprot:UN33061
MTIFVFVYGLIIKINDVLCGDLEHRIIVFPSLDSLSFETSTKIKKDVYDKSHSSTKVKQLLFSERGVFTSIDVIMATKSVKPREICEILRHHEKIEYCVTEEEFKIIEEKLVTRGYSDVSRDAKILDNVEDSEEIQYIIKHSKNFMKFKGK